MAWERLHQVLKIYFQKRLREGRLPSLTAPELILREVLEIYLQKRLREELEIYLQRRQQVREVTV
jgi:hypothetical protein